MDVKIGLGDDLETREALVDKIILVIAEDTPTERVRQED